MSYLKLITIFYLSLSSLVNISIFVKSESPQVENDGVSQSWYKPFKPRPQKLKLELQSVDLMTRKNSSDFNNFNSFKSKRSLNNWNQSPTLNLVPMQYSNPNSQLQWIFPLSSGVPNVGQRLTWPTVSQVSQIPPHKNQLNVAHSVLYSYPQPQPPIKGNQKSYQQFLILPTPPPFIYSSPQLQHHTHKDTNGYDISNQKQFTKKVPYPQVILAPHAEIVQPEPWNSEEEVEEEEDQHDSNLLTSINGRYLKPILYGTIAGLSIFTGYRAFTKYYSKQIGQTKLKFKSVQDKQQRPQIII